MTGRGPDPDAKAIYALYAPGLLPQAVRVALLLDLFTPLEDGALDTESLARTMGCTVEGVQILLDCLSASGLLVFSDRQYGLTPTAAEFLVRGKSTYAGDWVLAETDPSFWEGVLNSVRTGERAEGNFPWPQDALLDSYLPGREEHALSMWRAAGIDTEADGPLALLDLACGSGIKSLALARSRPGVSVTFIDSADVLAVTRSLASRLGVSDRVSFEAGDILNVELGRRRYDAALLGQITDYFTAAQNTDLFGRLRQALDPMGVLMIDVPMASEEPQIGPSLVSLLTWSISGGRAHSYDEYEEWLSDAGFQKIERLGKTWISARSGGIG
jgi:2-polyprenyl-3-methyl-5-hydroxy-6-metoxy-1,4-benzoquinol methylase